MSENLNDFCQRLSKIIYGITREEAHEKQICIDCRQPVSNPNDPEYRISGVGTCCQEEYFDED